MTTDQIALNAANVILADLAESGGGTYERGTLLPFRPKDGYAVGIGGTRYPASSFGADEALWLTAAAGGEWDTAYVGTWTDGGEVFVDAVRYFGADRREAAILCGYQHGQAAIYDFAAGESIYLGEEDLS